MFNEQVECLTKTCNNIIITDQKKRDHWKSKHDVSKQYKQVDSENKILKKDNSGSTVRIEYW